MIVIIICPNPATEIMLRRWFLSRFLQQFLPTLFSTDYGPIINTFYLQQVLVHVRGKKIAYFLHTYLEINQELVGKVSSHNDSRASTSGNQSSSKQSSTSAAAGGGATRSGTMPGMDLPIFTEEFLEHNKSKYK